MDSLSSGQVMTNSQNYALIFPKTGDGFAANILRIEKDSLILFTTDYKYVAKKDIGKIILHTKKESGKGFAIGSILGTYAMNYWLGTANGQPGGFLWDELYGNRYNTTNYYSSSPLAVVGIALLGIGIGGGIGYLTDLGGESNSEITYIFGGTPEMQEEQWAKAQEAVEHKTKRRKFHFGISGGLLFPNVANAYRDQLTAAGYVTNNSYYYYSPYYYGGSAPNMAKYQNLQGSSDFNWLRSLSLSYSITDNIQAGVCYALLGEPSFVFSNSNNVYPVSDTQLSRSYTVGQRLEGKGYYATATYNTFLGKNEDIEVTLTGGAGLANMSFDLDAAYTVISNSSTTTQTDNFSIRKTYFSAMVGGGLSYYLYDSFSLGLKANYFYVAKATAKAMPFVLVNEQSLNLGNADIGFTIGMHF
jgi:hypothetical protein